MDEGHGVIQGEGKTKDGFVQATVQTGQNAYVLSTSTLRDRDLMKEIGYNACLEIHDTTNFARAVAQQIEGFRSGWEGHCVYTDPRFISAVSDGFAASAEPRAKRAALESAGGDILFLKHRRFSHQAEYRFIWEVDSQVVGTLDVECPEARKFCRIAYRP